MDSIQYRVSQFCWSRVAQKIHFPGKTIQAEEAVLSCQKPDSRQTSLLSNIGAVWQGVSAIFCIYAIFYEIYL